MTKIAIILVILLIVAAGIYTELQRSNNLTATARRLGLEFSAGLQSIPADWQTPAFDLLVQGGREIANRMSGRLQGYPVDIFDYSFDATAAGEGFGAHPAVDEPTNMERRSQTVIRLQSAIRFPDFDVSPARGPMRQVAARQGFTPLVMEENRTFSQTYTLLTHDPSRCRQLFSAPVQRFLLDHPGLVVEGRGSQLLLYRFGQRHKAKAIPAFIDEAQALMGLFEVAYADTGDPVR